MSQNSPYRDKRSEFFRKYFELGQAYEDFLSRVEPSYAKRWREMEENLSLSKSQQETLSSFRRHMKVLAMVGAWCGDCARQAPMLRLIERECSTVEFRFLDNKANPELQEELRLNGAEKVPVIVVLSEDHFEVGRFGDRHLSAYRSKAKRELGPTCDAGIVAPPENELREELDEWVRYFERAELLLRLSPMLRRRYGD